MDSQCRICGNDSEHRTYVAKEMMFGIGTEFEYLECGRCGCLQIAEVPEDLARYYPEDYYSFSRLPVPAVTGLGFFLKRRRMQHLLGEESAIGRLATLVFGEPHLSTWLAPTGVRLDSRILDVGCGGGRLLLSMFENGFTDLTGVDPYVREDIRYASGVHVYRRELAEIEGPFDLVMMHHSFEHLPDQQDTLARLHERLAPGGVVLLRVPTVSSRAWSEYGTDWVQLDAPRHLYLHSVQSLELLAKASGFEVGRIDYDSTSFQFWGSEQYRRGITLRDARSYAVSPEGSAFSQAEIDAWERESEALNRAGQGDQLCLYLRKRPGV